MKVATFTLRASMPQSVRWQHAASAEGFRSVGVWAAYALDAYLRVRAKAGLPLPLAWHLGTFKARLMDGREVEVRGMVSPPFGVFQGTSHGPDRNKLRTLAHLPTGNVVATLRSSRQCRALAAELAGVLARGGGEETDIRAGPIVERHQREAT